MKKKIKSALGNILFVTICLLTCAASLYYFFSDLNKVTGRDEQEVAKIHFKRKIAQRKYSDSVIWERLQQNSPLYNEDIIRTDTGAVASINFIDPEFTLEINENTMIQILRSKTGELNVSVSSGSFAVDTSNATKDVKINLGNGSVLKLEKGTKLNASTGMGKDSVTVQEGSGNYIDVDGKENIILSGESVKVSDDGALKKSNITVSNMNSVKRVISFEEKSPVVKLDLKADDIQKKIIVETSTDKNFKNIVERIPVDSSLSADINIPEKNLYYRVYYEDEVEDAFEGNVFVENISKPRLSVPFNNSLFEKSEELLSVLFKWDVDSYSDFVRLEIYDEKNESVPVLTKEVYDSSFVLENPLEGNYKWRIVPHYAVNDIGYGDSSDLQSFSVVEKNIDYTPTLFVPVSESEVVLSSEPKNVLFVWDADAVNSDFELQISRDKKFNDIVYSTVEKTYRKAVSFSSSDLKQGSYYWRVSQKGKDSKTYFSEPRNFTVTDYVPKKTELVYPLERYSAEENNIKNIQFTWRVSDDLKANNLSYKVQFGNDKDFNQVIKTVDCEKNLYAGLELNSGSYYWRVVIFNKDNGTELEKTSSRNFTVMTGLGVPAITYPAENSVVDVLENNAVRISWQNVNGADFYKVGLYDAETKQLVAEAGNVNDNAVNLLVSDKYFDNEEGKYYCSVQAFARETEYSESRMSRISESHFQLSKIKKIQLLTPADGTVISGLSALHNPVRFNWKTTGTEKNVSFVLNKVNSNGTLTVVKTIDNPKNPVELRRLSSGNYRWTVNALSKNGAASSAEKAFNFTITRVPELNPCALVLPKDNFVIDPVYLKNNRKIIFQWKKNDYATDYVFSLYQVNPNGTLKRVTQVKTKDLRYEFAELSKLDVGKFQWSVTAYVHAKDGFEEQRSVASKGNFEISFELPDTVKVIDPGRMYGE